VYTGEKSVLTLKMIWACQVFMNLKELGLILKTGIET
jgi:hypothetical protein